LRLSAVNATARWVPAITHILWPLLRHQPSSSTDSTLPQLCPCLARLRKAQPAPALGQARTPRFALPCQRDDETFLLQHLLLLHAAVHPRLETSPLMPAAQGTGKLEHTHAVCIRNLKAHVDRASWTEQVGMRQHCMLTPKLGSIVQCKYTSVNVEGHCGATLSTSNGSPLCTGDSMDRPPCLTQT